MTQPLIKFLYYSSCEQRSDFEALLAVALGRPRMEGTIERGCLGILFELADSRVGFLPGNLRFTGLYVARTLSTSLSGREARVYKGQAL